MGLDIASYLKGKRKELKMSVKDVLSELHTHGIDISDKTLYGWESGHRQPDADTFIILCQIYGIDSFSSIYDPKTPTKKSPSDELSEEAVKVARDYSELDQPGKNVVRVVIAEEGKRVTAERERRQVAPAEPQETRYIPLYYTPAAAGLTSPAEGEDFEYVEVGKDVPWNTDFAVKIAGDSMEPYIRDGAIVYVNRQPIMNGDVGIWCVDGEMICKQYYKDRNGNTHLLSLNRNRKDADRYIEAENHDTVIAYYGRVILPRRPMVSLL